MDLRYYQSQRKSIFPPVVFKALILCCLGQFLCLQQSCAADDDVLVLEEIQVVREQEILKELDKIEKPTELPSVKAIKGQDTKEEPADALDTLVSDGSDKEEERVDVSQAQVDDEQDEDQKSLKVVPEQSSKTAEVEEKKAGDSVEINGDQVEYSVEKNMLIAEGNVVIVNKDMNLYCDKVEFDRAANIAYATGNVRLKMLKGEASEMTGEKLTFDVGSMTGTFDGGKIFAKPYFGYGEKISKVGENHMEMKNNYITTCDLDKPHYRLLSSKMDVYPGDKMVARNVRMLIGKIPMLYIPRFTQDLRQKEPMVTFTPGMDKEWGIFLLSNWRYHLNENFKGIIHVDARERKDLAWGIDLDYKIPDYGTGRVRTYYMNERNITSKRFYEKRPSPTIEKERFKVEWRHKWEVDDKTNMILQYYKISDSTLLKDYFEREFDADSSSNSFFLFTHILPSGTLSFLTEPRINRFTSQVERLPEIRYDLTNKEVFDTGFFVRNTTTYSNLTSKTASPSEVRQKTMRVDTDGDVSYPMKVGIFELRPFIGGRSTYYTKTKDPDKYGAIRGIFKTGSDISTRFYKVFDVHVDRFGLNINRLRHIITPSVAYVYNTLPTTTANQLDSFDGIDSLDLSHTLNFSLENKLQTKRNNISVELLRLLISVPFKLKEDPAKAGFNIISTDIDFKPVDWITFFFDAAYDSQKDYLTTANFDMYINGGSKWSVNIGKRWDREVDDQLTTGFNYKINPLWLFRTYSRFDLRNGILKEQEYTVSRDLHAWRMDLNFNETRKQGDEIWIVFTLKAFPDLAIDFGTSFNKRKAGSQSSEGE